MGRLIIAKITDPIFLTYELIVSNRRLILPTIIGLIIALTVISNSNVLIESYQKEIFDKMVFTGNEFFQNDGDISIDIYPEAWYDEPGTNPEILTNLEHYTECVNNSIYRVNYHDYISDYLWYSSFECAIWLNETQEYNPKDNKLHEFYTNIFASSKTQFYTQIEDLLEKEEQGRLPEKASEITLIRPKGEPIEEWDQEYEKRFENLTLNSNVNFTIPKWDIGDQEEQYNITLTIVGIVEYERSSWRYYNNYQEGSDSSSDNTTFNICSKYLHDFYNGYYFFTTPNLLNLLIKNLISSYSSSNLIQISGRVTGKVFLDKSRFNAFNISNEKHNLENFLLALEQELIANTYGLYISCSFYEHIKMYQQAIFGLLIILLLVSLPVICIALYLVVYSFSLIRKQKQEQIGIIKTRGGSWLQILIILLGEMVISTIIAVLIGFLASVFLADIVMRSTDYLEFFGAAVPVRATIDMLQTLIIWGIIFALLLNFLRIIRMSRQKIAETQIPTETKDPFWKRYYLDVIIFIIGTAIWIILMEISKNPQLINEEFSFMYTIIGLLGIPSPFLMFFGTIMVIARMFPLLMRKLSELVWKIEGGITAFSIRNIVRHKQAANRAVLLITLAMSFSILSSSLIFSLDETQRAKYFYEEGADITISEDGKLNKTLLSLLKNNVSHLTSISTVYHGSAQLQGYIYRYYQFIFVDPTTYAKTAFHESWFKLSSSISDLMNQISDNSTILLFRGNLKNNVPKLEIGDNFTFQVTTNQNQVNQFTFRIGGTFKYWPMLYPETYNDYSRTYWIIGSLGLLEKLNDSNIFNHLKGKYLAKIDSLANIENIGEEIYNITGVMPLSPAYQYSEYQKSFTRRFSLSILNSDLLICITITIVGVIMFAFFTYIERGKEIGVERALGMTRFQTSISFVVEAAMIMVFGTLIGLITGMYFVTMFLQVTQFGETVPPNIISYPVPLLIQMIIGIFIIAGIGTIIPAYISTRKDISRILKVE